MHTILLLSYLWLMQQTIKKIYNHYYLLLTIILWFNMKMVWLILNKKQRLNKIEDSYFDLYIYIFIYTYRESFLFYEKYSKIYYVFFFLLIYRKECDFYENSLYKSLRIFTCKITLTELLRAYALPFFSIHIIDRWCNATQLIQ